MHRESVVIDSSGKWAPAEEILENDTGVVGPPLPDKGPPNGHADRSVPSKQGENASGSALNTTRDPGRIAGGPIPPPPPPPRLPNSQGFILPSEPHQHTNGPSDNLQNIPLVPVRHASPVFPDAGRRSQISSSTEPNARQSTNISSTPFSQPYAPQPSRSSPASTPYVVQPFQPPAQLSYSGTPSGPQIPYQGARPSTTQQMFSSPAPTTQYATSPSPGTFFGQTPVSYPGGQSQFARASSYPQPQQVGTSPIYLPSGQSAAQSYRPATTNSMPTSQSVYGGTSQSYRPQTVPTPVQQASGSSQQPFTPGNFSYPNTTQMSAPMPGTKLLPMTPNRKKVDAFVANDPFRTQSNGKHGKEKDDMTFDDIPMPGPTPTPIPMPSSSGPMPMMPDPYPFSQQTYGGSMSAPPASGSYSTPVGYYMPSGHQASGGMGRHDSTSVSRPSQGGAYSRPASQIPNGPEPSQGQQLPHGQPRPMSPIQNGQTPYVVVHPGPPPTADESRPPMYSGGPILVPGSSSNPVGYYRPPSNQATGGMAPHESVSRPSQGVDYSSPVSQVPNGPAQPLGQPRPISPIESGQAPYLPGPVRRPTTDESVPNQPVAQPISNAAPSQAQPTYGAQSPPPSPPPGRQSAYNPAYEVDRMSWYDPYDAARIDPPGFPSPSPADPDHYPYPTSYYPKDDFGHPDQVYPATFKASWLSRIGNFFAWPFSRRTQLETYHPPAHAWDQTSAESKAGFPTVVIAFVAGTLPSQVYLHFLLRLPSLYFSRVARIFEEADLTLPEIKKMALETASQDKGQVDLRIFESSNVPPQYERLKSTWESFIDSVMREWKTFNIISVLLLSAILTILQIQGAADDPITRYTALFSLICALISLLFGCMYIIRFGSMRKTYKAAEWALEAKRTKTVIWWNVWVLLAMPAIWLTWSIILYIACIMSFVWRSSSQDDGPPILMSKGALLTVRLVITTVLGLGIIYGWLILSTFSRYGDAMDRAWKKRIDGWIEEKTQMQSGPYPYTPYFDPMSQPPMSQPPMSQPPMSYPSYPPYGEGSYPGFIDPRQTAPSYTDLGYGYSSDSKTGYTDPGFAPTYASASYVPPPEPYDSPTQSRAGSPQSTSSTLNITRSNTQHNKMSGLQREDSASGASAIYNGPGYPVRNPLPVPPKIPISPCDIPPRIVPKTTLAVPPPPSLPPIPGTPATAFSDNNSARNSSSSVGAGHTSSLGLDIGDREDDSHENRVRFRSPLISAKGSSLGENDRDAESPLQPSADASGLSTRLGSSPDSVELGQDNDSLRRRR